MCANKFIIDHYKMTKINASSCCIMVVKLIYIKFETVQSLIGFLPSSLIPRAFALHFLLLAVVFNR